MFPRALRWVSAAVLLLFCILCGLRLHGFSLPGWHEVIDGSPPREVLFGEPRGIRVDDWVVALPLVFSQDTLEPRFAPVNDRIAYGGVDALVGYSLPVRSWVTLFRPQVWGYFAGRDLGMAWQWWFRLLGLFYASYLAFSLLTRGRTWLALGAAAAAVFAPFFQFWSFNCEPVGAMALLCFTGLAGVALAASLRAILAWGALLVWSGGCFALGFIYPPYQISLAWMLVFLAAGYFWREREGVLGAGRRGLRAGVAGIAIVVVAGALVAYFAQHREAIRLVGATLYPGQRLSSGGEWRAGQLFDNFLAALLGKTWWEAFANVSETGAFFFCFPLMLAVSTWQWKSRKRRPDPVFLALSCFVLLAWVYAIVGVPDVVARLLFGGRVPGPRMVLAIGVADLAMLAVYLAFAVKDPPSGGRRAEMAIAALWGLALILVGRSMLSQVKGAGVGQVLLCAAFWLIFAVGLVKRERWALGFFVVVSVAITAGFNPLVRGGSTFLDDNPFSRKILELDRAGGGTTRWVVYQDPRLANLFRAIGVDNVGGCHYYPQMEMWTRLGLTEVEWGAKYYNRYGNVSFWLPDAEGDGRLALRNPHDDAIAVHVHPDDPHFGRLGVDYVVWVGPDHAPLDGTATLTWVASIGDKHIFRTHPPG